MIRVSVGLPSNPRLVCVSEGESRASGTTPGYFINIVQVYCFHNIFNEEGT